MKEDAEWLRNQLNQAMREQGWTCEHWARQAGVAPTTLTRFINKQTHHVLSTSTLLKLEKAIGKPLLGSVVEEHHWEHQEAVQNNRRVGLYVKSCREKEGYTQRRLAVELNLQHYGMISQIETGKIRMPFKWIPILTRLISADEIYLTHLVMSSYYPDIYNIVSQGNPDRIDPQKEVENEIHG